MLEPTDANTPTRTGSAKKRKRREGLESKPLSGNQRNTVPNRNCPPMI